MVESIQTICVCGAGTMGSGIAQVVAQNGFRAVLFDLDEKVLEKAAASIELNLSILHEKNKISLQEKISISSSIEFVSDIKECRGEVIIEAIIEKAESKIDLFNQLSAINHSETIFATNTSSLSVSAIAREVKNPSHVAGMHFFNPAPLMKLVEVVKSQYTNDQTVFSLCGLAKRLGKIPVVCKDLPGFIVNRVARHYYLEALALAEKGIADFETIDTILEATGFKMGPFKLMDLIGNDINLAVTRSLYDAFDNSIRFRPSPIQEEKVKKGELGRKTGKGYYTYQ